MLALAGFVAPFFVRHYFWMPLRWPCSPPRPRSHISHRCGRTDRRPLGLTPVVSRLGFANVAPLAGPRHHGHSFFQVPSVGELLLAGRRHLSRPQAYTGNGGVPPGPYCPGRALLVDGTPSLVESRRCGPPGRAVRAMLSPLQRCRFKLAAFFILLLRPSPAVDRESSRCPPSFVRPTRSPGSCRRGDVVPPSAPPIRRCCFKLAAFFIFLLRPLPVVDRESSRYPSSVVICSSAAVPRVVPSG